MVLENTSTDLLNNPKIIDFDLYGLVAIRLIAPADSDIEKIEKQLGVVQTTLQRPAEISIQFIEKFSVDRLIFLGLNSTAYWDDKFYLLDSKTAEIKAQIPFETIGTQCEIVCKSGLNIIPLLAEIIMLTLMKKNFLWLHASAFDYKGQSILVMGWEKGGKTETLLAFTNQGAAYIGDEMVALSHDGRKMFGIPIPMVVWQWQIKYLPNLSFKIKYQSRVLFGMILALDWFNRVCSKGKLKKFLLFRLLAELLPLLKRKLKVWVLPFDLFKKQKGRQGFTPDKVFLVMSHNQPAVSINSCSADEVAQCMASSNAFERVRFFKYYKAFKFAFPERHNNFLESIDEKQNAMILSAFTGIEAYKVMHPYPLSLDDLFAEMSPFCQQK